MFLDARMGVLTHNSQPNWSTPPLLDGVLYEHARSTAPRVVQRAQCVLTRFVGNLLDIETAAGVNAFLLKHTTMVYGFGNRPRSTRATPLVVIIATILSMGFTTSAS
jgi:hypothetical protein